jgi:hypothetical protein
LWPSSRWSTSCPAEADGAGRACCAPALAVVSAVSAELFKEIAGALCELAGEYPVYLGGAGANAIGGEFPTLTGDPVEESDRFAALTQ